MATGLIEAATPILNGLVGYEQMAELMEPFILTAVIVTPILLGALYVGARFLLRQYLQRDSNSNQGQYQPKLR
ncbi:hypothetical protein [Natronolimnobius baerhuensis]|uniref:Uncharacterized protein n=1 Tax=Natronolimnobius baerhuensis TaxID=253108 RepID=A0A202E802_9EURY|nr:hypothetical protein [Natronolimnobius baerhuensis]OVE84268.1 hypothetical protein B2G88_07570 [Natronolimnobius baerhuensis]